MPSLTRNLVSQAGIVIIIVALANLGFLIYLDATRANANPYMGILTWIIAPAILIGEFGTQDVRDAASERTVRVRNERT